MFRYLLVAAIAVLITDVHSQCGKPPARPSECCPTAISFITADQAKACAFKIGGKGGDSSGGKGGKGGKQQSSTGAPSTGGSGGKKGGGPSCDVAKCVMSQINLVSGSNVNRDAVLSVLTQKYPAEWRNNLSKVVQTCNGKVSASSECEPQKYLGCLMKELPRNCPDSLFAQTDKCNQLKTFWAQCPSPSKG